MYMESIDQAVRLLCKAASIHYRFPHDEALSTDSICRAHLSPQERSIPKFQLRFCGDKNLVATHQAIPGHKRLLRSELY